MKLTTKIINNALPEGYELIKGGGCFHFDGEGEYGKTWGWYTSSVYVYKLNDLSLEQWLEHFMALVETQNDRGFGSMHE